MAPKLVCAILSLAAVPTSSHFLTTKGGMHKFSLLQVLEGSSGSTGAGSLSTPVTRVVNLLKEMQTTLQKEMDEDEALYDKLACWCNNNEYSKDGSIASSE